MEASAQFKEDWKYLSSKGLLGLWGPSQSKPTTGAKLWCVVGPKVHEVACEASNPYAALRKLRLLFDETKIPEFHDIRDRPTASPPMSVVRRPRKAPRSIFGKRER